VRFTNSAFCSQRGRAHHIILGQVGMCTTLRLTRGDTGAANLGQVYLLDFIILILVHNNYLKTFAIKNN